MVKKKDNNKKNEFIKNTFILLIGKFATQFSTLLLIPIFTHYFMPDDYGWVDLLQTYVFLIVPVITLRMDSAVFRFLIDKRNDDKEKTIIITNSLFLLFIVFIFVSVLSLLFIYFIHFNYVILFIIYILVSLFSNVLIQILRGLGKNLQYSISSIISGVGCILINIFLIFVFNANAGSIFISSIISNCFVIIYVILNTKMYKYISKSSINKKTIFSMLKYSLPMIPNSLSWWIVNVSDRTLITYFIGKAYNGIYTVSCKFSNILNSIFSIVNMSWQETASLHINDDDKDDFFSNMINSIFMIFACFSLLIMAIIPIFFELLIGKEYALSYNYVPILLYANCWNVLISLLGGIYIALKKTKEIANTTFISAIINIFINFVFIKYIGLYAACISTLIAYLSMSIYRLFDCQKYIKVKLDFIKIMIFSLLFLVSGFIYLINNMMLNLLNLIVVVLYSLLINKNMLMYIFHSVRRKVIKK